MDLCRRAGRLTPDCAVASPTPPAHAPRSGSTRCGTEAVPALPRLARTLIQVALPLGGSASVIRLPSGSLMCAILPKSPARSSPRDRCASSRDLRASSMLGTTIVHMLDPAFRSLRNIWTLAPARSRTGSGRRRDDRSGLARTARCRSALTPLCRQWRAPRKFLGYPSRAPFEFFNERASH